MSIEVIASLITQIIPRKEQIRTIPDYQLCDLEGQISQGRRLLDSGESLNPGQLRAQLTILNRQRANLLAQRTLGLGIVGPYLCMGS